MKWRIGGIFSTESLRRILRIPLRLKCSSWCGGLAASNGGSWRSSMVVGGGKRGCQGLGGIWRGESENHVFHAEERIYNLQISLNELVLLSGSSRFALRATIRAQCNSLCTKSCSAGQFSLSAIPSQVEIALSAPLLAQRNSILGWNCAQLALLAQ